MVTGTAGFSTLIALNSVIESWSPMEALITHSTKAAPMVCLICCKSYEDTPILGTELVQPDSERIYANVVLDNTDRAKAYVPQPSKPAPMECRHVYVTEEEYLSGVNLRRRERIEEAHRQAAAARKRAAKGTRWFPTAAKDRMDSAFIAVKAESRWCMRNPPRMVTLKYPGTGRAKGGVRKLESSEVFWIDFAKSYEEIARHLKQFAALWELAFGFPLDAMRVLEFATRGYNPHFHLLMEIPVDSFGNEVRTVFNSKSKYYALLHNRTVTDFIELAWAKVTDQKADISRPDGKGNVSWVPKAHEVPPADSIKDYVMRFIDYSKKSGKNAGKITQHRVAWQWEDQQVNFWGLLGFKGLRRAKDEALVLECRTEAAFVAAMRYLREVDGIEARYEEMDALDGEGKTLVDVAPLSVDTNRLQGGRTRSRLTDQQRTTLRRLIAGYNVHSAPVVEDDEDYAEPFRRDARYIIAVVNSAPNWWEREGADVYLANMMAEEPLAAF